MRSTKSEWFSRLRFGAGGKASLRRPSVSDGHAQTGYPGSFTRFITAATLWLLTTLPFIQFASRAAPDSKARPPGNSSAPVPASSPGGQPGPSEAPGSREYDQARLENLKVDTRLKELQIQALKDEHELLPLKRREHEVNIENGEIKRDLTLVSAVLIGAMLVAGILLGIVDPNLKQPGPNFFELCKLLLAISR